MLGRLSIYESGLTSLADPPVKETEKEPDASNIDTAMVNG